MNLFVHPSNGLSKPSTETEDSKALTAVVPTAQIFLRSFFALFFQLLALLLFPG